MTFVILPNKRGYLFLLVLMYLIVFLILCIVNFGDPFQFPPLKVTNTFLPFWMITLDVLGFIYLNLSQKHKLLFNSFLTWLKLNLVQKSSVLEVTMAHNSLWRIFFKSKGILLQLTCVETPQQNAIIERKHQNILMQCGRVEA